MDVGSGKPEPRLCGATTRSGGRCRAYALRNAPNGRCRVHGGKSATKTIIETRRRPSRDGAKGTREGNPRPAQGTEPAPYSDAVLPGESELFADLPVGTVDAELKLCRLRLSRAAAAEARLIAGGEGEGLARIQDEINRITTRIDRLESRRARLLATDTAEAGLPADGSLNDAYALARAIRTALDEIEATTVPEADNADGDADA